MSTMEEEGGWWRGKDSSKRVGEKLFAKVKGAARSSELEEDEEEEETEVREGGKRGESAGRWRGGSVPEG